MKKSFYVALLLAFTQSAGASDACDMDNETLIHQVGTECGNAAEFDKYHADTLRTVPTPILRNLVTGGWFKLSLDEGPGLRNREKGFENSWSPVRIHHEPEGGGYTYHHIGDSKNREILDLSNKSLAFLPPALGDLTMLISLNLTANNLSVLPGDTLAHLTNLEILNLRMNCICALPPQIGGLRKLKTLVLEENPLVEFPSSFINLVNLQELYLSPSQIATNLPLLLNLQQQQRALRKTPVQVFSGSLMSRIDLGKLNLVEGPCTNFSHRDKPTNPFYSFEQIRRSRIQKDT